MGTLNCINWPGNSISQYTWIAHAWAAGKFTNTLGYPIKVTAVEVWCQGGTDGTFAFANTSATTTGAYVSDGAKPPESYAWKTYTLNSPMPVAAGGTFYAGIRGVSTSTRTYINGYQSSSEATSNAWYSEAGGTLTSYPTMGGAATRVLGFRVIYEDDCTAPTVSNLVATVSDGGKGNSVSLSWSSAAGTNNPIDSYNVTVTDATSGVTVTSFSQTEKSCTITNLPRGASYKICVQAIGTYSNSAQVCSVVSIERQGIVYADNGSSLEPCNIYVDTGSSWDQCIPYVDTGSTWDAYGA